MKKHAILLSGGVNSNYNYARYRNDLELAYRVLVEDCGFAKEDIRIFYANGMNINYAQEIIQTEVAGKDNIIEALEKEKNCLEREDRLVLIVSNHGGDDNGGYINLWGMETLNLVTICEMLEKVEATKILLLGECYAGNILEYNISNACVMTANMKGMISYANPYNAEYDEFLYHFLSYIHGSYPKGEVLSREGENNIRKAFQYAVEMDVFAPNSIIGDCIRKISQKNIVQIPQMKCNIEADITL